MLAKNTTYLSIYFFVCLLSGLTSCRCVAVFLENKRRSHHKMYSVVSHLYSRPQRQKKTLNKARRQDLSCPSRLIGYIRKRFNQDKGGSGGKYKREKNIRSHIINIELSSRSFFCFKLVSLRSH